MGLGELTMKVLIKEFAHNWSWGLVTPFLVSSLPGITFRTALSTEPIQERDFDVILSQQITMVEGIQGREKTVCRLGGNRTFNPPRQTMYDVEMRECFAIVATNKNLYDIAKKRNPNTYLIPNGLRLSDWKVIIPIESFTVGFAGNVKHPRYREYKGYDFLVEACSKLKVPLKSALYGKVQIAHSRMWEDFYSKISVLVHPTRGEGCSNTIMEALACGVPVITTREAGYHGELLVDGENVLFCTRDADDIADKISKVMNDSALWHKLSNNGRKFAEEHHDIRSIALQYEKIFRDCSMKSIRLNKEKTTMVYVQTTHKIGENGGMYNSGDVFQTTLFRARQLVGKKKVVLCPSPKAL